MLRVVPRFFAPLLLGSALVVAGMLPAPAGAQESGTGTDIGSGLVVQGVTITGPCVRATRKLDDRQAAAFLQPWLPNAIFGKPVVEDPPAALPVCRVSVRYSAAGQPVKPMQVDYASDGKTAWVALPPQALWPGVFVSVHRWTVALPRAVEAFAGKAEPLPVTTTPSSTPTSNGIAAPAGENTSSSDDSAAPWIIVAVVVGIGLLLGGIGYAVRRRRVAAAAPDGAPS